MIIDRDEFLKDVSKQHQEEVREVIIDAKRIRSDLKSASAMSDKGMRLFMGTIPGHFYHALGRRYGYECWDDPKFIRTFFNVYNKFKITNRY